eukprot:gene23720-9271_t
MQLGTGSGFGRLGGRQAAPGRKLSLRPTIVRHAKKKEGSKDDDDANANKADFSAYWALKIKNLFSQRRRYLDGADEKFKSGKLPEIFTKLERIQAADEKSKSEKLREISTKLERILAADDKAKSGKLPEIFTKLEIIQAANQRQLDKIQKAKLDAQRKFLGVAADKVDEIIADGQKKAKPWEFLVGGKPLELLDPGSPRLIVNDDVDKAREQMRTSAVFNIGLILERSRSWMQAVLMAPIILAKSIQQSWSATFTSERYENFMMAEGERIWFWRNRTENERWFWEIHFWDQMLFPIICTIAYEYLCPNHIIWAVAVPLTFIAHQSGSLPGLMDLEFWLIAYFGLYKKCWGDVMALVSMVMV